MPLISTLCLSPFEAGQLRSALLLAFPDQWAALQTRCMPRQADDAETDAWPAGRPPFTRSHRISGGTGPSFVAWQKVRECQTVVSAAEWELPLRHLILTLDGTRYAGAAERLRALS